MFQHPCWCIFLFFSLAYTKFNFLSWTDFRWHMSSIFLPDWPLLFLQINVGLLSMLGLCLPLDLLCPSLRLQHLRDKLSFVKINNATIRPMKTHQIGPLLPNARRSSSNLFLPGSNSQRQFQTQPSPSVPQCCTDDGRRIQAELGSSSLTFIFYCYSLVCLLMKGAARQTPAALCWFRNESRKVFWILIYKTFVVCLCFQDVQFNSLISTNIHCFRTK